MNRRVRRAIAKEAGVLKVKNRLNLKELSEYYKATNEKGKLLHVENLQKQAVQQYEYDAKKHEERVAYKMNVLGLSEEEIIAEVHQRKSNKTKTVDSQKDSNSEE
jgi:hypothetical protein